MAERTIGIRDVTLRDGLQDEAVVATDDKVALFEALVAAGIDDVELTSFVRPDRVPAMADAPELTAATAARPGITRWALALNAKGAQRAVAAGLDHLQYVISVSDTHSRHNAGRSTAAAVADLAAIAADLPDRVVVEVTLATAFGCPYDGAVAPARVLAVLDDVLAHDVAGVSLADTIGTGVPSEVRRLVTATVDAVGDRPVGVHLHDTRGLGIANALAAIEGGACRVDGSVGGLGGCPFAPGASGNLPLEDLVHLLDAEGVDTGVDIDGLIAAAELACGLVGRSVDSHIGKAGPRFASAGRTGV
ncbi:MAG: hydroxymethylglutaryl-CoA lyase [Desertimonas sp.]